MAEEGFIKFIWKYRLYKASSLYTSTGQRLVILDPGEQNPHGGPDFLYARVRIDDLLWAGNVEIHSFASDWYRHRHHLNPAYNNVILHVVGSFDTDVTNSLGRRIPAMVPEYQAYLRRRYEILKRNESWLPCGDFLKSISNTRLRHWLHCLSEDRIFHKSRNVEQILRNTASGLDHALCRILAPGYGLPLNTLPFEMLLNRIPLQVLIEHRHNQTDLEALLFGQSGLLFPARTQGSYPSSLWKRYTALNMPFAHTPVPLHLWKFLRLRPPAFPTVRISQYASLLHQRYPLSESLLEFTSMGEMEQLFRVRASEYWTSHYSFGKASPPLPKYPGRQFISTLIINVIVPFLTVLHKSENCRGAMLLAGQILQNLEAESNRIIRNWSIFGIRAENAKESQALLQLYHYYCKQKRCLECRIGTEIVRDAIHEFK